MNVFDIGCTGNRQQVMNFFRLKLRVICLYANKETVVCGFLKIL